MARTFDTPPDDAAKQASEKAVDGQALLDGENPATRHPEDAEHWAAAYSELINFKESLLDNGESNIEQMSNPNSKLEARQVDMTLLQAELNRYRARLEFWKQRQKELRTQRA